MLEVISDRLEWHCQIQPGLDMSVCPSFVICSRSLLGFAIEVEGLKHIIREPNEDQTVAAWLSVIEWVAQDAH
jgi:hypothetical protein